MNPFTKQKEKIGFALHIFDAKKYAKRNKKVVKKIEKSVNKQEDLVNDIDSAKKERSIKKITETTKKFISEGMNELRLLDSVQENVFTIEYKMIKELRNVIKDLDGLKRAKTGEGESLINTVAQEGLTTIYSLFNEIHKKTKDARRQTKRAKKGEIGIGDLVIEQLPDALEFRSLKVSSRKERKEIKKVDKVLEDLHKVIKGIYQGERNNEQIEKVKSDIVELKTDIEHELVFLSKALSVIAVLITRLKKFNEEETEKVISLVDQGFPNTAKRKIEEKQTNFKTLSKNLIEKEILRNKELVGETWGKTL